MTPTARWTAGLVFVAGISSALTWGVLTKRGEHDEEEHEASSGAASHVIHAADGSTVVQLDRPTQERIALKLQPIEAASLQPEVAAYGLLAVDPSRSFVLRAPLAGIVHEAKERPWPNVGQRVTEGQTVGAIVPRFGPMDRVDLMARLTTARAEVQENEADLFAERSSFENKRRLNIENKIVSDRTLEEVEAKVKASEARLLAAKENVRLLEESLHQASGPGTPMSLAVELAGEVVECLCRPGEAVESGQALLRIERFDQMLARVELPVGQSVDLPTGSSKTARVAVAGHEDTPLTGEVLSYAPNPNSKSLGQALLIRVRPGDTPLRPGMAVVAHLPLAGNPVKGVTIPRGSVVRFGGAAWVYVQVSDDSFARREVKLPHPTEHGWFVSDGFDAGQHIVVDGAQVLLSEEIKSQFESEAE
jgi:RND family efflux transporter MFP subunit